MRRLRPNIIALAGMVTAIVIASMGAIVGLRFAGADTHIYATVAGLAGVAITGLLTLAGRIAEDPPPPAFPANELPALIAALRDAGVPLPETRDDHA